MSILQPLLAKMQQDLQSYLQTQMEAQFSVLAVTLQRLSALTFPTEVLGDALAFGKRQQVAAQLCSRVVLCVEQCLRAALQCSPAVLCPRSRSGSVRAANVVRSHIPGISIKECLSHFVIDCVYEHCLIYHITKKERYNKILSVILFSIYSRADPYPVDRTHRLGFYPSEADVEGVFADCFVFFMFWYFCGL